MNLFQVNLIVSDFQEALRFYRDGLGLEVHDTIDPGPPSVPLVNWASLSAGQVILELFDARSFGRGSPRPGRDAIELAFIVDDVDESRDRLEAAGIACGAVTQEQWGRFASFQDPDGNTLQIFEVFDTRRRSQF